MATHNPFDLSPANPFELGVGACEGNPFEVGEGAVGAFTPRQRLFAQLITGWTRRPGGYWTNTRWPGQALWRDARGTFHPVIRGRRTLGVRGAVGVNNEWGNTDADGDLLTAEGGALQDAANAMNDAFGNGGGQPGGGGGGLLDDVLKEGRPLTQAEIDHLKAMQDAPAGQGIPDVPNVIPNPLPVTTPPPIKGKGTSTMTYLLAGAAAVFVGLKFL